MMVLLLNAVTQSGLMVLEVAMLSYNIDEDVYAWSETMSDTVTSMLAEELVAGCVSCCRLEQAMSLRTLLNQAVN